jgi:hypothetical protein
MEESVILKELELMRKDIENINTTISGIKNSLKINSLFNRCALDDDVLKDSFGEKVTEAEMGVELFKLKNFFTWLADANTNMKEPRHINFFNVDRNLLYNIFGIAADEEFYVRRSYIDLGEILLKEGCNKRVIISGSPGIGKTLFSIFWMWRILREFPEGNVV